MSDRDAFIRAIRQRPNDPLPRLIFADWLDENTGDVPAPPGLSHLEGAGGRFSNGFAIESALQRVLAEPDEDRHRLAYADAVQGTDPERAEFVRVQVELAGIDKAADAPGRLVRRIADQIGSPHVCVLVEDEGRYKRLRRRERELFGVPASDRLSRPIHFSGVPCMRCNWHEPIPHGGFSWMFRRGFVDWIDCSATDFFRHAASITDATPLREVRLTSWPEFDFFRQLEPNDGSEPRETAWKFIGSAAYRSLDYPDCVQDRREIRVDVLLGIQFPRIKFEFPPAVANSRMGGYDVNAAQMPTEALSGLLHQNSELYGRILSGYTSTFPVVGGGVAQGGDQMEV